MTILHRFLFIYLPPCQCLSAKLSVTDAACMLQSKSSYMHAKPPCHYPLLVGHIIKLLIQFLPFLPSSPPVKVIAIDPDTRGPRSASSSCQLCRRLRCSSIPGGTLCLPFLPFIGYSRLLGGSCFLCKEIGIRIVPKRVEVHMSKTLKLGLQQVDPALSLFLHSTPALPPRKQNIPFIQKTLNNVKMIEP
jgi:hypothetical protein